MAKVNQNDFTGTVNEVINSAKEAGVVHLHADGSSLNGRKKGPKRSPSAGVMFCYKNSSTYVPSFVGMDYKYSELFSIYRQLLYHTILRAKELNCSRIDFGLTAAFEKKKLGAFVNPKVCYVQAKDNFSLELLETLQNSR